MKSDEWGPHIWILIHLVAFCIPNEKYFKNFINYYFSFYYSLRDVIPCPICRNHYKNLMNDYKIENCKSKKDLIEWTIMIHNKVNNNLNKKTLTKEDVFKIKFPNKSLYFALDTIALNRQYVVPLKAYSVFFNTLRVVFPVFKVKKALINAMSSIPIKVNNHRDLREWYIRLGHYIQNVI